MHYNCLILTEDHETNIEIIAEKVLAPYSEHIKVAYYDRDCACISHRRFRELVEKHSSKPCPLCFGKGSYKSNYNPIAKWDYYSVGGRWDTMLGSNVVAVKKLLDPENDFDPSTIFALVEPDGTWNQAHSLLDASDKEKHHWTKLLQEILIKHKNSRAILCDLHI